MEMVKGDISLVRRVYIRKVKKPSKEVTHELVVLFKDYLQIIVERGTLKNLRRRDRIKTINYAFEVKKGIKED